MMKVQKEKKFKREYIPVVILAFILIVLLVLLVLVIGYEKKDFNIPDIKEDDYEINEIIVDTSNSSCDPVTINKIYDEVSKIKYSYKEERVVVGTGVDIMTLEKKDVYGYVFNIEFTNIPEKTYLKITNDNLYSTKPEEKIEAIKIKDGKFTYQTEYTDDLVNYKIEVYTLNEGCTDELFREFTIETPIFNRYANMDICSEFPKFEYCQKFITTDRPNTDEFYEKLYAYMEKEKLYIEDYDFLTATPGDKKQPTGGKDYITKEEQEIQKQEEKEKQNKILKDNIVYIVLGTVAVVTVIAVIVIIIKKRGKKA